MLRTFARECSDVNDKVVYRLILKVANNIIDNIARENLNNNVVTLYLHVLYRIFF